MLVTSHLPLTNIYYTLTYQITYQINQRNEIYPPIYLLYFYHWYLSRYTSFYTSPFIADYRRLSPLMSACLRSSAFNCPSARFRSANRCFNLVFNIVKKIKKTTPLMSKNLTNYCSIIFIIYMSLALVNPKPLVLYMV